MSYGTVEYTLERGGENVEISLDYHYIRGTPGRWNCAAEDAMPPEPTEVVLYDQDLPYELTRYERECIENLVIEIEEDV